jgi:hypothetical protein
MQKSRKGGKIKKKKISLTSNQRFVGHMSRTGMKGSSRRFERHHRSHLIATGISLTC